MTLQTLPNSKPTDLHRPVPTAGEQANAARIAELVALQRIGRELNSTLDESQILNLLIRETVATTPATHGSVFLRDEREGIRYPQAWYGYTPQQVHDLECVGKMAGRGIVNRVLVTGQVAVTDDVRQDSDYIEIVPTTRSELTVPIQHGTEIVGVVDLESPEPNAFDPDSQRFVLAIAEQAAIAIGNARRYAQQVALEVASSKRNEQLRNLIEISRMLHSDHALDDVLDHIVQAIPTAVGFNIALLSLVAGDPPVLRRVAGAGIPLADLTALKQIRQPLSAFERALQERYRISQSYFFPHQEQEEWEKGLHTLTLLEDTGDWKPGDWHPRDMLLVPLRDSKGQLLGLLSVDDPQDRKAPSQESIETLELFANEAASTIEHTRLMDETRQHVAELELLRQVGLQVASSLDLNTVLETIVSSTLQLVPASDVRIYLYDQRTGTFDCGTQKSSGDLLSRPMELPRKDGFTTRVARQGEITVINEAQTHSLYTRPESQGWGIHAIAGLPLKRADEVLGVMDVSFFYEHTFSQKELDLLSMLANQAAIAIDNVRQYEQAKKRALHLEALWHVSQQLASILDFDQLLDQTVEVIESYFDYDRIHIYLLDKPNNRLILRATSGQANPPLTEAERIVSLDQPDCVLAWVAVYDEPLLISDALALAQPLASETPSELAVPLHIGDEVAGVLDVRSNRANALTWEDLSIIQSQSAQLSLALHNARLYDELERRVQERTEELANALQRQALEADRIKAILESISDAVIVFDPQGDVILANPSTTRILGLPAQQWIGHNLNEERAPDLPEKNQEMMAAVFHATRSVLRSLANARALASKVFEVAGQVIACSFTAVSLHAAGPLNIVAVFRDITREAQLDRMKSEFIAMAAHEIRTPMTAIKGYVDLLAAGIPGSVNDKQKACLQTVRANAERMMTLVSDLLDISRIESEGLKLHLQPVSLADIVAEAVIALQKQIDSKKQQLTIDVPVDLPEAIADRDRMIQVVINLLSNATKYTPQGGTISVRGWHTDGRLHLQVCDSGIGISAQDQERLFKRFFRADNAVKTQESGAGLGLVICREIVERHGGEIVIASELGQGSTFQIVLPVDVARSA